MTSSPTPPDDQKPATVTLPEPVRADSVSSRFEPARRHAPVSLSTVAIALIVSIVATLVITATVLGLQLMAGSLSAY